MAKAKRKTSDFTIYHLTPEHDGKTLAAALRAVEAGASWGQVKKWISRRHVQVNGNLCLDEARRVRSGDVIKVWKRPLARPVEVKDIRVAYLDEHLIVVEKPPGVTSVRHFEERKISTRRRQLQPTLEELLPPVLAKMQHLRWPPLPPKGMNRGRRPGSQRGKQPSLPIQNAKKLPPELQVYPVHRLDRETSGLMLFARTRKVEQHLIGMFRRHTIRREYTGVCFGAIEPQTIESELVRDRGDGRRGSLPEGASPDLRASAKKAVTHILGSEPLGRTTDFPVDRAGNDTTFCTTDFPVRREFPPEPLYSLIRCRLETGRTHQIRIHLAEAGHMLCGDRLYNTDRQGNKMDDRSGAPRHALHSDRLAFTHPFTGEEMQFEMTMPQDLADWLERLKASLQSTDS